MKCCDAWGRCTRGSDCCARAAEAQPTQPPLDWIPDPKDLCEPMSLGEMVVVTGIVLALCFASAVLIYASIRFIFPGWLS